MLPGLKNIRSTSWRIASPALRTSVHGDGGGPACSLAVIVMRRSVSACERGENFGITSASIENIPGAPGFGGIASVAVCLKNP